MPGPFLTKFERLLNEPWVSAIGCDIIAVYGFYFYVERYVF